jgi:diguanylate cyclase (GGDEF)-like protein
MDGVDESGATSVIDAKRIHDLAFGQAARLLLPCQILGLPMIAAIGIVTRHDVDSTPLTVWWILAGIAMSVSVLAWVLHRQDLAAGGSGCNPSALIHLSSIAVGVAWGYALFVPASHDVERMLTFGVFAYAAGAFGMLLTSASTSLFMCLGLPLFTLASAVLISSGGTAEMTVGAIGFTYFVFAGVAHRVSNRGITAAIEANLRMNDLMGGLEAEHELLQQANAAQTELNQQLGHQAAHDPLTGLFNRRGALDALDAALATATPTEPVGLLYLDLDRFKHINDTLGHRGGDQFIAVIADRLSRSIDPGATAGRIGGDEFIAVLPGCDLGASMAIASRITAVLAQPVHAEGREVPSSVSVGVAVGPAHGEGSSELLRHANAALHRAKARGRNRVDVFDGTVRSELNERLDSEQALRRALDDGDIVAYFQPEIDATTGQVVGAELLARWIRRDGTVASAMDFIGVAAQAGLLERMTDLVMQQARPLIRRLSMLGLPDGFRFRVNVPPRATERSWRENPLDSLIQGIEPSLLTVDVTEAAVVDDLAAAAANLAAVRVRGVRICLDDFARGVSSLSLLRRLPLDEVRIDRTSIDAITAHPHDRAIVRSIIGLVREIGLTATADGVETGAQADALIALGCIRHQGHLYSRALPASEFDSYLARAMAERFEQQVTALTHPPEDYSDWPTLGA